MVPIRAVTLTRKREVEEAERDSGEKQKQGLYARNQTEWIIPPPIEDGRIPKNAYGNIDCFVPTMVPRGAVHIPLRKTVMICKKLGIDYAEAVTGFEFGNKMAVPVIEGVVVAEKHENLVIDRWEKEEKERKIKEEGKREKMALGTWRKLLMGLRIIQRVEEEYGGNPDADIKEASNPFTNQGKGQRARLEVHTSHNAPAKRSPVIDDEELGGGFIIEDHAADEEELETSSKINLETRQHVSQASVGGLETEGHLPSRRGLTLIATNANGEHLNEHHHSPETSEHEEGSDLPQSIPRPTKSSSSSKKISKDHDVVPHSTSKASSKAQSKLLLT